MDEFKPEDELKPDTSDRRPTRQQKRSHFSVPKIELSRQHLMIAIGILVLVLLIIGIGSALQAPSHQQTSQPQSQGEKSIDLSSSSPTAPTESAAPVENPSAVTGQAPQTLSAPPVSDTPTQAPVQPPVSGQQRIELPGNITDALAQQQGRVDEFSQGAAGGSTLPTAPATVAPTAKAPAQGPAEKPARSGNSAQGNNRQAATNTQKAAAPAATGKSAAGSGAAIQNAPASHFTLQLSGASRSDTLKAYARQHNLAHSWVYETKRDGKSWYVLVTGVYASAAEARQAIATLPADVQAKKPWVKPIRQVKQDLNK
ncbi:MULTISPECIES: SPOR domain-containing protein [Brenneria]|uniref:Cell division protein DamX n=1 Tax=Brenneria nigrifluens DSM 30175 = ATCC 13028 TaxID=1121120 RepID=A0A2U1UTE3_9GAMM|nr:MULTISPECIES: SPOR domain-containing protein [Brenneria]EHD19844.1 Sporulation domain-containing protein [Brenneria sp. EniD312]PWC24907.1 SPOR domain-containing protein [Brenneria nigrifluens DSM 30175 = ATCC 13028]QCR03098.1 SPOR domain-containing protein [Brenneria nigrifluens DSM 30175 = ATCC 13028]